MSKHIRMLNPVDSDVLVRNVCYVTCPFEPCYVMPCDCAGPGGLCFIPIPDLPKLPDA